MIYFIIAFFYKLKFWQFQKFFFIYPVKFNFEFKSVDLLKVSFHNPCDRKT